ncbi:MAG: hypothetical protein M9931_03695 [Chitinophagales bacterium]|nr:hypothetical protein [Chitinophagales bacterium]
MNIKIVMIFFSMSMILCMVEGCKKNTCEGTSTNYYGEYRFNYTDSVFEIQFKSNYTKASLIIGEDVSDNFFPICMSKEFFGFSKSSGKVCFNFSLPDSTCTNFPISGGPGQVNTKQYIRLDNFFEQ